MSGQSKRFVSAALVILGLVLFFLFLRVGAPSGTPTSAVLVTTLPALFSETTWDIYARYGSIGVVMGVVVPICAFAAATAVWLSQKV
jgi:hypothetical protein